MVSVTSQIIFIQPQNPIAAVLSATKFQLVNMNRTEDIEVQSLVPSHTNLSNFAPVLN